MSRARIYFDGNAKRGPEQTCTPLFQGSIDKLNRLILSPVSIRCQSARAAIWCLQIVSGQEYCTKLKWEHEELTDILISFPGSVEGFITPVSSFGLSSFSSFNISFILFLKVSSSRLLGLCGIFKYYLICFRSCVRRSCFVTFLTRRHTDACQPWRHFLFYKMRYYQALFIG